MRLKKVQLLPCSVLSKQKGYKSMDRLSILVCVKLIFFFFKIEKMELDEEIEGFRVVAESLKRLGVKYMFGVVGIPVVEVIK